MRARRATKYVEDDDITLAASEGLPTLNAVVRTREETDAAGVGAVNDDGKR